MELVVTLLDVGLASSQIDLYKAFNGDCVH